MVTGGDTWLIVDGILHADVSDNFEVGLLIHAQCELVAGLVEGGIAVPGPMKKRHLFATKGTHEQVGSLVLDRPKYPAVIVDPSNG